MKLPLYCISDNHFSIIQSSQEDFRRNKLFSMLDKIKSTGGTLIIGGDFFDFWFDYENKHNSEYDSLFLNLSELSNSGIEIHYILGNHDYWDFGYFMKKFNGITYNHDLITKINKKKILITHGDGLLKADIGYRLLRKLIRSKICIFLFKLLGSKVGYKIAQKISTTSAHYHHHDDNSEAIISEICSKMEKDYNDDFDYILVGHYHQTGIYNVNEMEVIFMGDWLNKFTLTSYDGEKWTQEYWDN